MIPLKLMQRLSRLEEECEQLGKDLDTPLPPELRYERNLARLEKHFEERGEHEGLERIRLNRRPGKRR